MDFFLGGGEDGAIVTEDDGADAGGTGVEGEDVGHKDEVRVLGVKEAVKEGAEGGTDDGTEEGDGEVGPVRGAFVGDGEEEMSEGVNAWRDKS